MTAKPLFDFSKLQDLDKQKQAGNEQLDTLLDQNDLIRKKIPDGPNSLLRAISDALYSTPQYSNEIKQHLFNHLTYLIDNDKLTPRLGMFRGNTVVLKDYITNPELLGFDKINLELVSSQFKVKIVVYSISDDGFLSSIIANNHYQRTIRIARIKHGQYEPVYSKSHMEKLGAVQNVVLNILEKVVNQDNNLPFKDFNEDSYLNFEYFDWLNSLNDKTTGSETPGDFTGLSPIHFINKPPPGLNPSKYPQKVFPFVDVGHASTPGGEASAPSPGFQRSENSLATPTRPMFSTFGQASASSPVRNHGLRLTVQSSQGATEVDQGTLSAKKKPIILDESKERYTGRLKFFDEAKKYGFIIMDGDGSDIFVHMDDLMKANITKEMLTQPKNGVILRLAFSCMKYIGGYGKSRKATDIELLP